jgi:hypothetical protein
MMKKIFNFYFSTVAIVSAFAIFGGIVVLIGNKFNYILDVSALIGLFGILFLTIKRLIQYFYLKTLVLRKSYNLRDFFINFTVGIFFIFAARQLDLLWIGIPANVVFGVLLLFVGLIGIPKFLKLGKESITIYELAKREIKYIDLLSFDYKDHTIVFEAKGLNYELKVFSIDANQIDKIKKIVKDNNIPAK